MTAVLGWLAAAVLAVALAGTLYELRRVRALLRREREHADWQAGILARRGWRRDAGGADPKGPHKPRLWRHEPPRQG